MKRKKRNPELLLGVTGCVAQQEGEHIRERMPHVDLIVGTQQIYQLPDMVGRLAQKQTSREIATNLDAAFEIPPFQKLLENEPPSPAPQGFKRFVTIMQAAITFVPTAWFQEPEGVRSVVRLLIFLKKLKSLFAKVYVKLRSWDKTSTRMVRPTLLPNKLLAFQNFFAGGCS